MRRPETKWATSGKKKNDSYLAPAELEDFSVIAYKCGSMSRVNARSANLKHASESRSRRKWHNEPVKQGSKLTQQRSTRIVDTTSRSSRSLYDLGWVFGGAPIFAVWSRGRFKTHAVPFDAINWWPSQGDEVSGSFPSLPECMDFRITGVLHIALAAVTWDPLGCFNGPWLRG